MRIIVFVGLPGAGKSTKAKEFESQGYVVHSPDAIRNKYNLHKKEDINEVLSILNNNLINDLQQGKDIIYDSTNSYHFPTSDEGWDKIILYNQDEKVIFEDDALW